MGLLGAGSSGRDNYVKFPQTNIHLKWLTPTLDFILEHSFLSKFFNTSHCLEICASLKEFVIMSVEI